MSDTLQLGQLITTEQHRDAVHIAVAPVVAGGRLEPGDHVGLIDGKAVIALPYVGIIDPFLLKPVKADERCWLFMYPGTITSLRHEWTHPHPAFKANDKTEQQHAAESWLRGFAGRVGYTYEELIETGTEALDHGSAHVGDDDRQDAFGAVKREFLRNIAIVTGKLPPRDDTEVYFSCAC